MCICGVAYRTRGGILREARNGSRAAQTGRPEPEQTAVIDLNSDLCNQAARRAASFDAALFPEGRGSVARVYWGKREIERAREREIGDVKER